MSDLAHDYHDEDSYKIRRAHDTVCISTTTWLPRLQRFPVVRPAPGPAHTAGSSGDPTISPWAPAALHNL